ncbi:MAG: MmcQ/YjbR family DNA-binding protein [Acidobacteriaceae bacterium]
MDADLLRSYLLTLPHVEETMQWGESLVFWVGHKALGGKMFAVANLYHEGRAVLSFAATPDRFAELLETEGVIPAPYLARAHWVAIKQWDSLPTPQLKSLLEEARTLVENKLPKRTREALTLPAAQRKKLIAATKKQLAKKN